MVYPHSDGVNQNADKIISITVTPVNNPPVRFSDSPGVTENPVLTHNTAQGVRADHREIEGNVLVTIGLVEQCDARHADPERNGGFTYTPNANYNGPDGFTYTAWTASRRQPGRRDLVSPR